MYIQLSIFVEKFVKIFYKKQDKALFLLKILVKKLKKQ